MKCIDSRPSDAGRRRKYIDDDGVKHETIEVPLDLWRALTRVGRAQDRAAEWKRARTRGLVQQAALKHKTEGIGATQSAMMLGMPVRTVQRWRAMQKQGA